jgi:CRP/FNR family transcriptional regulator, polysaccharide utilization system transcription regulator
MNTKKGKCTNCIDGKNTIFSLLSEKEREILNKSHTCLNYKKSEIIYKEGDKPTGLICLIEGKVKIFKEGVGGREQIIRMAKPKEFIGYRALFAEENYISSAVAIEDCTICIIEKDALFKTIRANGDFGLKVIKVFATELGISNNRTVSLTQKHIRGRLAESLLFLKDTYGFENDGNTINISLSREDLANLSNMTTSNAIRTLSTFANEHILEIVGRKIKITDLHSLEKISTLG